MKDKIKFKKQHTDSFKKMGIQTIYLFGSQVQGRTHRLSDVDIGVVFSEPEKYKGKTLDVYSKLYSIFTDVLPKDYLQHRFELKAHEFDIVFLQFAPIGLQHDASQNGIVLYEKSKEESSEYKENVLRRFLDISYFYDIFDKSLLQRI